MKWIAILVVGGPLFVLSTSFTMVALTPMPARPKVQDPFSSTKVCDSTANITSDLKKESFKPFMVTGAHQGYGVVVWQHHKTDRTVYVAQKDGVSCILAVGAYTIYQPPKGIAKI